MGHFEWGKRGHVVAQRKEQLSQANENLHRVQKRIEVEVDKAYRRLEQTNRLVDVAANPWRCTKKTCGLKAMG